MAAAGRHPSHFGDDGRGGARRAAIAVVRTARDAAAVLFRLNHVSEKTLCGTFQK
jgi:hypothetical protein